MFAPRISTKQLALTCRSVGVGLEAGGSYDQTDAEGFLRIMGLPLRVQGQVRPRSY